jgi:outer membrane protein
MKNRVINSVAALAAAIVITAAPAQAYEAGDWIVRAGPTGILPLNSDSTAVPGIPDSGVEVDNAWTLGFTIAYMFTNNIGLELLGVVPPKHDINGDKSISSLDTIATTRVLPPTLSLQYYFDLSPKFHPYVGAGINYTTFFDEDTKGALSGTTINLSDSWGLAGQLGIDYDIGSNWLVNAAVWYIDIDPQAHIRGVGNVDVNLDPWVVHVGFGHRF